MVPYRGSQQKRGVRGNGGRANMSRSLDFDDYRPYEEHVRDREYRNYNYNNFENSRTHFYHPRDPVPDSDYYDAPRGTTASLPELGKCVECDLSPHVMVYRY